MPYVKSHSNYLLKKEHQNVKNGKVYERDLLTIGALDQFAPGQTPIYKSGNFIFTVNDEPFYPKKPSETSWFENESGSTWSIANLIGLDLTTNASSDKRIELKNDFYSLRDFAYYGSCVTLVRGSITDIINRFPSEMYIPTEEVDYYYTPCGQANDDIFNKIQDLMIPLGNKLVVKEIGDSDIRYSGDTDLVIPLSLTITTTATPRVANCECPCNVTPTDSYNICSNKNYEHAYSESTTSQQTGITITHEKWTKPFGMTAQDVVDDYNEQLDGIYNDTLQINRNKVYNKINNNNVLKITAFCDGENVTGKTYMPTGCTNKIISLVDKVEPKIDVIEKEDDRTIVVANQVHGTITLEITYNGSSTPKKISGRDSITYPIEDNDVSYKVTFGEVNGLKAPSSKTGVIPTSGGLVISGTYGTLEKKINLALKRGSTTNYGVYNAINVSVSSTTDPTVTDHFSNASSITIVYSGTTAKCTIDVPVFAENVNGFTQNPPLYKSCNNVLVSSAPANIVYSAATISTSGKADVEATLLVTTNGISVSGEISDLHSPTYSSVTCFILSNYSLTSRTNTYSVNFKRDYPYYDFKEVTTNKLFGRYLKYYYLHDSSTSKVSYSDSPQPPYITIEDLRRLVPEYFGYDHISQSGITVGSESISVDDKFYGVKNPFRIDTTREYATKAEIDENPLKYFNVIGWEKYDIINANGDVEPISAVETEYIEGSSIFGPDKEKIVGDLICETYISGASGTTLQLSSFISNNKIVRQLIPFDGEYEEYQYRGYHIRPKYEYYVDFIDSLDSFQKILMSLKTEPIYKATFETISEGNVAYENRLVDYIFPIDDGGYNLDIQSMAYNVYLSSLVNIATYYDEHFSDNMYRNMTHESIKNMDWTYRTPDDDNADDYDNGETRVAQLIRLFGREFDEIKYYIDNIKNANTITYNDINNTPNYFLSDNLELKGWDAQQVQFEYLSEYFFDENGDKIFREIDYSSNTFVDTSYTYVENENVVNDGVKSYHLNRLFSQMDDFVACPYYSEDNGYFVSGNCESIIRYPSSGNVYLIDEKFGYHSRVKSFASDYCYTPNQVNNEFIKRLILSSRSIFSRKGTIESIEELLSLFGLRSKRWITEMSDSEFYEDSNVWDFDIKEYTTYTNPLLDIFNEYYDNNFIDFINSTKEIPLHETEYVRYEGLPISYEEDVIREGETEDIDEIGELRSKDTTIYPFFIDGYMYDDNLYYQSSGGWLIKEPFQMTKDNDIRTKNDTEDCNNYLYTETVNTIRYVKTINDLFDIPFSELRNNIIVNIEDLSQDYVMIDEQLFKIEKEDWGSGVTMFFTIECGDKSLYFGNHSYYYDEESGVTWYSDGNTTEPLNTNNIEVTSINGNDEKRIVNIPTLSDGEKIKVYIAQSESVEGRYVFAIGDYVSLNTCFLMGGNYDFVKKEEGKTPTTYFRLEDIYGNYKIGSGGWMQVYAEDEEYKHLRTITETSFGNNPHNGNMRYDCGYGYIDHFDKLFKLPYEDSLIDTRCYKSYYEEIMDNDGNSLLPLIGFKGIKCSDDDCVICYKEYEDTKVHDFCDIIEDSGNTASYYDKPKYGDDNTRHLSGMSPNDDELTYEEIYEQISSYTSNVVETYDYSPITSGLPINDNTNQIVNLKRVDLIFNMEKDHVGEYQSKNYLEAYHYIDNVIMKYVEQVIPSNVIMKVVYKSDNG